MTNANQVIRTALITTVALTTAAALWATGTVGYKRLRHRIAENAAALNETLPINSKWWRDHAKEKGELLYVAIGDSAAQGIGASEPNRGYVGVLADHIRLATGRTVRVINLSVSGATVELAVRDQLPRFVKLTPDIVTVAIGANDIALWDAAVFTAGIREVFSALPDHAIVADLPCFHFRHNELKVAVANAIVREVAAEHDLTVVPLHATTKRQGFRSIATQFANDMFHPNDRGYRIWAEAFLPALSVDVANRFPRQPSPTTPQQTPADGDITQTTGPAPVGVGGAS